MGNWRWLALSKQLFHLTFIYIAFVGDLSIHKYATFFYLNNKTKMQQLRVHFIACIGGILLLFIFNY